LHSPATNLDIMSTAGF